MSKMANRARMTVSSTGTGDIALGAAVVGFQAFAAAGIANGDTISYAIEDGANWEVGTGVYSSTGPTLSRNTVVASSSSGAPISITTGAQVFVTALASDLQAGMSATNLVERDSTGAIRLNDGTAAAPSLSRNNDDCGIFFPAADQVGISTNGTQRAVVSSSGLTLSSPLTVASGGTGVTTSTGTGSVVLSNSPTLVTPDLGTPSSGNLANCTFPTLNQNTTGTAAGLSATLNVASGGTGLTSLTAGHIPFGNGTSAFGSSANLFWDSANSRLGVGTTTPDASLTVSAVASFADGSASAPSIAHTGDLNCGIFFPAADQIAFTVSGGERFRISNGFFGVNAGVVSSATINISGNSPSNATSRTIVSTPVIQSGVITSYDTVLSYPSIIDAAFTLGNLSHFSALQGTKGASATITNQYGFRVDSSLTGATNNYGFYSNIASGTGRWNFYANGTADNYFAGNVGINRTNPQALLDIALSAANQTGLRISNTSGTNNYAEILFSIGTSAPSSGYSSYIRSISNYSTNYSSVLTFGTSASSTGAPQERMRIDSSGNVGIGCIPTVPLDMVANSNSNAFRIRGRSSDNVSTVDFLSNSATGASYLYIQAAPSYAAFGTQNVERLRIDSSGNVGINATSSSNIQFRVGGLAPSATNSFTTYFDQLIPATATSSYTAFLSVPSTAASAFTCPFVTHYKASQGALGSGSAITIQYGFHATASMTGATNNFGFYSEIPSGTGRWNFYANGTADNYFAGNVLGASAISAGNTTNTGTSGVVRLTATGGVGYIQSGLAISANSAAPLVFGSVFAGAEWMRITSSGNVGIGTSSPGERLSVSGAITATTSIRSSGATSGIGYATGAGGTVTQATSRTTGVTIDKVCGQITLVSAAGSTSWQSFTVTNSAVASTDTIIVNQDAGTDLYQIFVTNVAAGSFRITFATTGGTTTEQPVFGFSVIKAVAA